METGAAQPKATLLTSALLTLVLVFVAFYIYGVIMCAAGKREEPATILVMGFFYCFGVIATSVYAIRQTDARRRWLAATVLISVLTALIVAGALLAATLIWFDHGSAGSPTAVDFVAMAVLSASIIFMWVAVGREYVQLHRVVI